MRRPPAARTAGNDPVRRQLLRGAALGLWIIGGLVLWGGAGLLCADGSCREPAVGRQLLGWLDGLRQPWLDVLMSAATWLGSVAVLLPCALLLAWWIQRPGRRLAALLPILALGGAWLFAHLGKLLVARPRPDLHVALVPMPEDYAYPSAHAMQVTAFALACLLIPGTRPGRAAVAAAVLVVLLVAFSRLYLQVHFPSDVLFGMIAAAAWVLGLRLLLATRA